MRNNKMFLKMFVFINIVEGRSRELEPRDCQIPGRIQYIWFFHLGQVEKVQRRPHLPVMRVMRLGAGRSMARG